MKDVRDGDLCRKISLMNGSRLHTFEYRLSDHDMLLQYTNLRCILMYFDPLNQQPPVEKMSSEIRRKIPLKTIYELFSVIWLVLKEEPQKIKFMQLSRDDEVSELVYETEFMSEILKIMPKVHLHQIMVSEADKNEIEGLPMDLTDITMVISLKVDTTEEVITVSDDSVIIISD